MTSGSCSEYVIGVVKEIGELAGSIASTAMGDIDIGGIVENTADIASQFALPICSQ